MVADAACPALHRISDRGLSRLLHRHRVRPADHPNVAGVTTLLHEAWEPTDAERGHTSGQEAATIAVEAGVSRLVLTHGHPLPGVPERTAAAAQRLFPATVSATDGAALQL